MRVKKVSVLVTLSFIVIVSLLLESCKINFNKENTADILEEVQTKEVDVDSIIEEPKEKTSNNTSKEVKSIEAKAVEKPIEANSKTYIQTKEQLRTLLIDNLKKANDTIFQAAEGLIKEGIDKIAINMAETSGYGGYIDSVEYSINKDKVSLQFKYKDGKEGFLKKISQVEAKVKSIAASVIKPGMTEFQKELALHDYLVNNTRYDYENLQRNTLPEDVYTAYGVFINKSAVCEGYAEAMYRLLNAVDIKNYIVIGNANGNPHAWNLVSIEGKYYHLDSTFDDPISDTGDILSYNYFNVNDSDISKDHSWNKADYPVSTSKEGNYYIKNNIYAGNADEYYSIIKKGLENKQAVIRCKTESYNTNKYKTDIINIIAKERKMKYVDLSEGYSYSYDEENCIIEFYVKYK